MSRKIQQLLCYTKNLKRGCGGSIPYIPRENAHGHYTLKFKFHKPLFISFELKKSLIIE